MTLLNMFSGVENGKSVGFEAYLSYLLAAKQFEKYKQPPQPSRDMTHSAVVQHFERSGTSEGSRSDRSNLAPIPRDRHAPIRFQVLY